MSRGSIWSSRDMSVSNQTLQEFENAAAEAIKAMNGAADLLVVAGMRELAQLLRLRAVALDLAGEACAGERRDASREDIPPDPSGEAVVRLDDGDITRLLADQIAEEFGVDLCKLENIPRATLLRLRAELDRARRLRLPRVTLAPQILDIIGRQPGDKSEMEPAQPRGYWIGECWYPNQPEDAGSELATDQELHDACAAVTLAGRKFWEARARVLGSAAVVWVEDHDGALVIYTRGEYRQQLLAAIPTPKSGTVQVYPDTNREAQS